MSLINTSNMKSPGETPVSWTLLSDVFVEDLGLKYGKNLFFQVLCLPSEALLFLAQQHRVNCMNSMINFLQTQLFKPLRPAIQYVVSNVHTINNEEYLQQLFRKCLFFQFKKNCTGEMSYCYLHQRLYEQLCAYKCLNEIVPNGKFYTWDFCDSESVNRQIKL